ncbi:MAG: hypothetical protein PHC94_03765 [Methylobacter sp.]|nr:hypothetical protein [Methylobacter sp.]
MPCIGGARHSEHGGPIYDSEQNLTWLADANYAKTSFLSLLAVVVLMISGWADTTPVKNLALPPVSTIEGTVTQLDENGYAIRQFRLNLC